MMRNTKIVGVAILGAIVLFLAAIPGLRFFNEWRAERAGYKLEEELMRPYNEDFVGGKTPEETFQLFLDALRREDIDAAAKYFVIDKQEEWRKSFSEIKAKGEWGNMMKDVSRAKAVQNEEENALYEAIGDEGLVTVSLDIVKQRNGVWKIRSL